MPDLSLLDWTLLCVGVFCIGIAKTAVGGAGSIAVAAFALVLPARESTGAIMPLLIAGDLIAVAIYRHHTNWRLIRRLLPWVAVGVVGGAGFVAVADDSVMRRVIGGVLLALALLQLVTRGGRLAERLGDPGAGPRSAGQHVGGVLAGVAAGFVSMVANVAGTVTTIYLLLSGLTKLQFLGTTAWFFLLVNLFKLPFSIGLGLVQPAALQLDLVLLPVVGVGALAGVLLVRRMDQAQFEKAVLVLACLSAVPLLL